MKNHLIFTTTVDPSSNLLNFSLDGMLTMDGETFPVGVMSANFDRVFDELVYWTRLIENCLVSFHTKEYHF